MKKLMTVLFIAMVGVCFADYKSDFGWGLMDSAKIEKGLAEAKAAKDEAWTRNYLVLKLTNGKTSKNITYNELKKSFKDNGLPDFKLVQAIRLLPHLIEFIPGVLNDKTISDSKSLQYMSVYYSTFQGTLKYIDMGDIDIKLWREKFINLDTFDLLEKNYKRANNFLSTYKKYSKKFTAEEIKADAALMKRAWYSNIQISNDWKNLLVQIELMMKSVQ